jgi:hypothetical protein
MLEFAATILGDEKMKQMKTFAMLFSQEERKITV